MKEHDYQFKRLLLKEELEGVRTLIDEAPEFMNHYPRYKKWLDNSLLDVSEGNRLAYGVMKSVALHGCAGLKLIGVIIIKPTEPIAELKSLFVDPDYRGKEQQYANVLYANTEKHLVASGMSKVITDVPCANKSTVWFLIKQGYNIEGVVERYKKGDKNYVMSKDLVPQYTGDLFDWKNLSLWLLKTTYGCTIEHEADTSSGECRVSFLVNSLGGNSLALASRLKGVAHIYDGDVDEDTAATILEAISAEHVPLSMVIARSFENHVAGTYHKSRIVAIDEEKLYRQCGCERPRFPREDIGGIIAEIRHLYFSRITPQETDFVYFKGGGVGKFLRKGDAIYFMVDSCEGHPYGAIMARGRIREVSVGTPDQQWRRYSRVNPKFQQEEYWRFARYKHTVLSVLVSDFERILPIECADVPRILGNGIDSGLVGNLYLNNSELEMLARNTASESEGAGVSGANGQRNLKDDIGEIKRRLCEFEETQKEIRQVTLAIKNDLVTIDAKGVKDTFKIKLSTPASGILPLSAEKELSFDLAKYSYEEIRETLRDALGEGGRKVAQLFKVLKVLKKR